MSSFTNRTTQHDVAKLAGVTRATVSYVLTGRAEELKITPEVIERVRNAADKLKYVPNLAARALVRGRSETIGLAVPNPGLHRVGFWGPLLVGVEQAAFAAKQDILLLSSNDDLFETARLYLLQNRIDVVIILGGLMGLPWSALPVPPVSVGRSTQELNIPSVSPNVRPAIKAAVAEMKAIGAERILWLSPRMPLDEGMSSLDRVEAVRHSCKEATIPLQEKELSPFDHSRNGSNSSELGHWINEIEESGLEIHPRDGILCWNDSIALGLFQVLFKRGLMPGRDVAVVGFDNQLSHLAHPALASIGFNTEKMGAIAVQTALQNYEELRGGADPASVSKASIPVDARLLKRPSLALNSMRPR